MPWNRASSASTLIAGRRRTSKSGEVRSDFAETLYWHPALVLANGQAEIGFDLCDSVTTFQVFVAGHTSEGRLGATTADVVSRKPFGLSATVPLEVTANDTIDLPVAVANNSDEAPARPCRSGVGKPDPDRWHLLGQPARSAPRPP